MAQILLTVPGFRCDRCNHEWIPRDKSESPRVCPKCKSPYWNRPRKAKKQQEMNEVEMDQKPDPGSE
jgi:predicted Zn-ribbon and HTH transcriptional regulator